jgi:hypothetical protein
MGAGISVQGHGRRLGRQAWGPPQPEAIPDLRLVDLRRYRCIRCKAVITVAPRETLTKRLYTASAIGWALALYGCLLLPPAAIREQLSPWRVVGNASAPRWVTLLRWAAAVAEGRLFRCVRPMPPDWDARKVAERAATTLAAYALPTPDPPPLEVLAFHGAALAA